MYIHYILPFVDNNPICSDVGSLRQCIVDVLTSHYADLRDVTQAQQALPDLAARLFTSGIISDCVKDNPSYDNLVKSFETSLNFLESQEAILEHCRKFFAAFYSCCGPLTIAANTVTQDITERVREKLGVEFIIVCNLE